MYKKNSFFLASDFLLWTSYFNEEIINKEIGAFIIIMVNYFQFFFFL